MFDNLSPSTKSPVEDIFAGTEANQVNNFTPLDRGLNPVMPPPLPAIGSGAFPSPTSTSGGKKWIVIVVVVLVLAGGGAAYWWYSQSSQKSDAPIVNTNSNVKVEEVNDTNLDNNLVTIPSEPVRDSDGDGLDDPKEITLGTDLNNSDSDGDGLNDGEEVNFFHTNPLNQDSDGDGYTDKVEVDNNYNPNGPGKLMELPNGALNMEELDQIINDINKEPATSFSS